MIQAVALVLVLSCRRHEEMSMRVLDHIVDEVGLDLDQQQLRRIKDAISGEQTQGGSWGPGQEYLTQVRKEPRSLRFLSSASCWWYQAAFILD